MYYKDDAHSAGAKSFAGRRKLIYFSPIALRKQCITLAHWHIRLNAGLEWEFDVRFGSKADMCGAIRHVRFSFDNNRESRHTAMGISALVPGSSSTGRWDCPTPISKCITSSRTPSFS